MKKMKKRKGMIQGMFTPLGITIGILMASIAAWNTIPIILENEWKDNINTSFKNIDTMVNGVIGLNGFIDNSVAPCSSGLTTVGLSAKTLNECNGFKNYLLTSGGTDTNGLDSYYEILKNEGSGCKVFFGEDTTNNQQFYIYLECDIGNKNEVIENYFTAHLKKSFEVEFQTVDNLAIGLYTPSGGTKTDGKARFLFKK